MNDVSWNLKNARFEKYSFESTVNRQLSALRPDNYKGALYIAKDYAVMIAATLSVIYISWWLYPVAVLLIGVHQRGLTTISHDFAHRILAKNKTWNYVLGVVFAAYPLFQRHYAYRVSHVYQHHPFLGDPDRNPDLQFFLESGVYEVRHRVDYIMRIVVLPILGGATLAYLKYLWANRFSIKEGLGHHEEKAKVRLDTIGFFLFWGVIIAGSLWLGLFAEILLFWIVPYLTTFQILGWFIESAEHSPMYETETTSIYLTRSRKGNWLERVLFGVNLDEYHLEHHLSPGIPFWHLRTAQHIRMQDPGFAKVAKTWGGLFVSRPQGQKSVIRQLLERNDRQYWAQRFQLETGTAHPPATPEAKA